MVPYQEFDDEFKKVFDESIVLRISDDQENGGLLGFDFKKFIWIRRLEAASKVSTPDNAKRSLSLYRNRLLLFFLIKCTRNCVYCLVILPLRYNKQSY